MKGLELQNQFLYQRKCVHEYQVYGILPVGLWESLVHEGFPAPPAVLWQLYTHQHKNSSIKIQTAKELDFIDPKVGSGGI